LHVIVVTGTRSLRREHQPVISRRLKKCVPAELAIQDVAFMSGGSWGVDTYWALEAQRLYPEACHILAAPSSPWNEKGLLEAKWDRVVHPLGGYRGRNAYMVSQAHQVEGFPLKPEANMPRSGTWMTVRMARRREEVELKVLMLDG